MMTKIKVSHVSPSLKACMFLFLIAVSCCAHAEYYVVYGAPVTVVECISCGPRVVSAPYRPYHRARVYHHHVRHYHRYRQVWVAPREPRSSYQIDVYYVWQPIPPSPCCGCARPVPMCKSCDQWSPCPVPQSGYDMNSYNEPWGETVVHDDDEGYGHDWDRATTDDVYPELNIDN